jgi:putative ABC transport system ATP-binding protein
VAIARALVNAPPLLLADEPTGNLDSKTGAGILELLLRMNQERGLTLVLVTHDHRIAAQAGRVIRLYDGLIDSDGDLADEKGSESVAAHLSVAKGVG